MMSIRLPLSLFFFASALLITSDAGTVSLNGPAVQTSDLRRIDSYVSSTLPIFPKGFNLYNTGISGNRPIIIKSIDPERSGTPQPNPGYYTNLPAVIPAGLEGIATTTFILGAPISTQLRSSSIEGATSTTSVQGNQIAQSSVRVENSFGPIARSSAINEGALIEAAQPNPNNLLPNEPRRLIPNPVVEATAEYEATLPPQLRNPFYSNGMTASSLAQESLPTSEEQVVMSWNTNKIREGKVRELLTGAGLI